MGSSCSSSLRRFRRKRRKPSRPLSNLCDNEGEESGDYIIQADSDTARGAQSEQLKSTTKISRPTCELIVENEPTTQSEIDDDHASTASCYTNGKNNNNNEKSTIKTGEHSSQLDTKSKGPIQTQALSPAPPACYIPAQRVFNIRDNHRHVVVIYQAKGRLCVFDIYQEKAVRTVNNLDQPKDLRMIDHRRAVILCNRELKVYDLNTGNMLTKLKGVMNQKMPFFEVFGDNYVVALARNRMYVNMLNLNTGELETTFKVGEDRFLNSLLVSANGGVCVCGDETQKPFPLLVWNLNERKLLYDLRLEGHEFLTKMSAISDNGHFVVSVCRQCGDNSTVGGSMASGSSLTNNPPSSGSPDTGCSSFNPPTRKSIQNFIVVYDLTSGTLFQKWDPGLDTCGVTICLSSNRSGYVINSIVDHSIIVWDLSTGSRRHTLLGHSAPVDILTVQNNRLLSLDSTGRDQSLRLWDVDEGHCLATFSHDSPIDSCQLSIRGDAIVCGPANATKLKIFHTNKTDRKKERRRSSKSQSYIFDEPQSRKSSS